MISNEALRNGRVMPSIAALRRAASKALPLLALAGLILLFFWKLAFTNLVLARGDVFLYFYPYWEYRAEVLSAGHLPLWNPYLFMGAPFLANSQAGVLYPLNWPLIWLSAPSAVKVSVLAHLGIAAAGTYLFGHSRLSLSRSAAVLGAALVALGGYLTAQVEHVNQLQGLAWFPALLYLADQAAGGWEGVDRSPRNNAGHVSSHPATSRRRAAAWMGLVIALQLTAGHTQSAFISITGAVFYSAWLWGSNREDAHSRIRAWKDGVVFWALALALALLLAAAQVLPSLELSNESIRSGGLGRGDAVSFSLHPLLVGRALLPSYSRSLFSEYVGFVGVIGLGRSALGALTIRGAPKRQGIAILGALGLVLAVGGFNPLYYALAGFPPLDLFRAPARWLWPFAFGAAMMAACGYD